MRLKVLHGFTDQDRYYRPGDIYETTNQQNANHLLRTGQCSMEKYPFGKKEEKVDQIKTKEVKVDQIEIKNESKSELDELREQYAEKFGKEADKRWKEERLQEELSDD